MLTPEQASARKGRIGSSDVPKILGISPYGKKSPAQQKRDAYFDILQLSPRKESASMRDGVFMEPAIIAFAEWKVGKGVLTKHTQYTHAEHDWAIASLDAEGGNLDKDEAFIVEAKYVENPDHVAHWGRAGNTKQANVPDYVLAQVMHQLWVCGPGYESAYIACYRPWAGFGLYGPIARDEELIGLIVEAERQFMVDHITPKVAPEIPADEQQEGNAA